MAQRDTRETGFGVVSGEIQAILIDAEGDRECGAHRNYMEPWTDEEMDAYIGAIKEARDLIKERDDDTLAVREACSDYGNDEGPRGIRQLYARYKDRISRLP